MLTVTMTTPTSYYLRGFVGETYAGGRWTPLDSASLAESAGTFYWLHQDGFRSLTQLTAAARAAAPELLDTVNTVTVENTGASSKYLYAPYELRYDTPVPDENAVGEASLAAPAFAASGRIPSPPPGTSSPNTAASARLWRRTPRPTPLFWMRRAPITALPTTTIPMSPTISAAS